MTLEPALLELIADALSLMSRPFIRSSAGYVFEFYHQFRKLWDRGIPVGMGLGHILIEPTDTPLSLSIRRLGEGQFAAGELALVRFYTTETLSQRGHAANTVLVVMGTTIELADLPPAPAGLTRILFDTSRWTSTPGLVL